MPPSQATGGEVTEGGVSESKSGDIDGSGDSGGEAGSGPETDSPTESAPVSPSKVDQTQGGEGAAGVDDAHVAADEALDLHLRQQIGLEALHIGKRHLLCRGRKLCVRVPAGRVPATGDAAASPRDEPGVRQHRHCPPYLDET